MNEMRLGRREIETAWAGWPIPEMIGGAIPAGIVGLSAVTVIPALSTVVPNVVGLAAGAVLGAVLSWVWRPRRIALEAQRDMIHAMTPEERPVRRAA